MYARSDALVKAFKVFHSGQSEALQQILTAERSRIFDYVMRMTAHLVKASDTVREALDSLEPVADSAESLDELIIMMYKTARNFAIDSWNVDTSKLENSNYENNSAGHAKDTQILVALEHAVRVLAPQQREVLLLVERFWFQPDEVAEIMGISSPDVESLLAEAQAHVEASVEALHGKLHEMMNKLREFSEPEMDTMATQNLSLIMNDFKKTDRLGRSRSKWVWIAVFVVLSGAAYTYRMDLEAFIKARLDSSNSTAE